MEIGVDVDQKKEGTFIKDQNSFWAMSDDDLIEFLKEDLKKSRWDKAIIEGVPEEKVSILTKWIKNNEGKIEGIEVSIIPTLTGLTVEEEELFENEYSSMLAVDRTKLIKNKIERIQINLATQYIAGSESQREDAQLRWWKQKLKKAKAQDKRNSYRFKRAIKATKENKNTTKKYIKTSLRLQNATKEKKEIYEKLEEAKPKIEAHDNRGKGPRLDKDPLNLSIGDFDKYKISQKGKQSPSEVARWFESHIIKNLEKYEYFIINVRNKDDNLEYWKTVRGERKKMTASWEHMYKRVYRARNNRKKEAKIKK